MRLLCGLLCAALIVLGMPIARADVDGSVPSTGSCPYPAVGTFGAAGGEFDYGCAFPIEINGSRHTTLFGGGMWQVTASVGVSFMIFNAGISAAIPAGVLRGIAYWACPDLSMAGQPNPVGAWNKKITPTPCKSLAPPPVLLREPPTPPPGVPPPGPLPPGLLPPSPPAEPETGAQTNPTPGNPVAPEGPSRR